MGCKYEIIVLTGSPHKEGTSALMADQFILGAKESGHEIIRFDAGLQKLNPCIGCDNCKSGANKCIYSDAISELYPKLIKADIVVFITPLYYHGYSAQIKSVIDRFHGIDNYLRGSDKKSILIVTAAYTQNWVFEGIVANYKTTLKYLGWKDIGKLLAYNCYLRTDIENTDYPKQAYELGKNI